MILGGDATSFGVFPLLTEDGTLSTAEATRAVLDAGARPDAPASGRAPEPVRLEFHADRPGDSDAPVEALHRLRVLPGIVSTHRSVREDGSVDLVLEARVPFLDLHGYQEVMARAGLVTQPVGAESIDLRHESIAGTPVDAQLWSSVQREPGVLQAILDVGDKTVRVVIGTRERNRASWEVRFREMGFEPIPDTDR